MHVNMAEIPSDALQIRGKQESRTAERDGFIHLPLSPTSGSSWLAMAVAGDVVKLVMRMRN